MQYKSHLNLRQRAALKIAISFWERKVIKDKVTEFFESCDKFKTYEIGQEWNELTKTVVDEWNKGELPRTLEAELIHLVRMMGEKIFNWFQYISHEYNAKVEAIKCLDKIKWTPYGTVDVVEIFKSSLLNNPHLNITKVYNFACRYAITDHIDDLWNKIPRDIQDDCHKNIYRRFNQHMLAYWKHCRNNDLPNLMRYFQIAADNFDEEDIQVFDLLLDGEEVFNLLYDLSRSTEENMLRLTVYQGHFIAMKYFWEKLTEDERKESVLKCARIAVLRWSHYAEEHESIGDYKMCQYVEICIFLMNQMTNRDKKSFFNENLELELGLPNRDKFDVKSRILSMLLSTWPWEKLFMPVLEDMLQLQDDDSKMDCAFLDTITSHMREDHELGYSLKSSIYRCLLREAWLIIPASIKRKIAQENPYSRLISYLIDVWDLDSLNLILNDPEIADVRDQFINLGSFSYKQFIVDDQFDKLDHLMEELFKFGEEEKKSFKQKINPWSDIFAIHKFDVADKFLDWQSSTPEERQSLKNNINHMEICEKLIKYDNYKLINNILDWKFETIEERIKCKDNFKTGIFTIRHVYYTWRWSGWDLNDVEEKSSRFLDWVFESNEEIRRFKKEKLTNFEIDQSIFDNLVLWQVTGIINKFLSWCLLDDREIERIKQAVSMRFQRPA